MKLFKINIKDELFGIINDYETVLIQFSASWCGPCKKITPKIATYLDSIKTDKSAYIYVDMDKFKDFSNLLKVKSIPAFTVHNKTNNRFSDILVSSNLQVIQSYIGDKLSI
jgi:thiol-disulfide isomerase/thioredoxin